MKLILPLRKKIFTTSIEDTPEERYYSKNKFVRYMYTQRLQLAIDLLNKKKYAKILDAGCGSGILIPTLKQFGEVYAFDMHDNLAKVRKNINANYVKADLLELPFKKASFDLITCISVLEHVSNLDKALKELKFVLKKKGALIVGIPSDNLFVKLWFFVKRSSALKTHHASKEQIMKAIEKHFRIEAKKELKLGPVVFYTLVRCF